MIKKNKTLTIAMLIGVVVIYGTIIYKSLANKQLEAEQTGVNTLDLNYSIVNYKKDNFEIIDKINDPFKGRAFSENSSLCISNELPKPSVQVKKPLIPVITQWPDIKYYGFVKNTSVKKNGLCLVKIDQQLVKIQKGETFNNIRIISVFQDSIQVLFDDTFRTVIKEN